MDEEAIKEALTGGRRLSSAYVGKLFQSGKLRQVTRRYETRNTCATKIIFPTFFICTVFV